MFQTTTDDVHFVSCHCINLYWWMGPTSKLVKFSELSGVQQMAEDFLAFLCNHGIRNTLNWLIQICGFEDILKRASKYVPMPNTLIAHLLINHIIRCTLKPLHLYTICLFAANTRYATSLWTDLNCQFFWWNQSVTAIFDFSSMFHIVTQALGYIYHLVVCYTMDPKYILY